MEAWRHGGMEAWRLGGLEAWRLGNGKWEMENELRRSSMTVAPDNVRGKKDCDIKSPLPLMGCNDAERIHREGRGRVGRFDDLTI
jgi:hypothetical protein